MKQALSLTPGVWTREENDSFSRVCDFNFDVDLYDDDLVYLCYNDMTMEHIQFFYNYNKYRDMLNKCKNKTNKNNKNEKQTKKESSLLNGSDFCDDIVNLNLDNETVMSILEQTVVVRDECKFDRTACARFTILEVTQNIQVTEYDEQLAEAISDMPSFIIDKEFENIDSSLGIKVTEPTKLSTLVTKKAFLTTIGNELNQAVSEVCGFDTKVAFKNDGEHGYFVFSDNGGEKLSSFCLSQLSRGGIDVFSVMQRVNCGEASLFLDVDESSALLRELSSMYLEKHIGIPVSIELPAQVTEILGKISGMMSSASQTAYSAMGVMNTTAFALAIINLVMNYSSAENLWILVSSTLMTCLGALQIHFAIDSVQEIMRAFINGSSMVEHSNGWCDLTSFFTVLLSFLKVPFDIINEFVASHGKTLKNIATLSLAHRSLSSIAQSVYDALLWLVNKMKAVLGFDNLDKISAEYEENLKTLNLLLSLNAESIVRADPLVASRVISIRNSLLQMQVRLMKTGQSSRNVDLQKKVSALIKSGDSLFEAARIHSMIGPERQRPLSVRLYGKSGIGKTTIVKELTTKVLAEAGIQLNWSSNVYARSLVEEFHDTYDSINHIVHRCDDTLDYLSEEMMAKYSDVFTKIIDTAPYLLNTTLTGAERNKQYTSKIYIETANTSVPASLEKQPELMQHMCRRLDAVINVQVKEEAGTTTPTGVIWKTKKRSLDNYILQVYQPIIVSGRVALKPIETPNVVAFLAERLRQYSSEFKESMAVAQAEYALQLDSKLDMAYESSFRNLVDTLDNDDWLFEVKKILRDGITDPTTLAFWTPSTKPGKLLLEKIGTVLAMKVSENKPQEVVNTSFLEQLGLTPAQIKSKIDSHYVSEYISKLWVAMENLLSENWQIIVAAIAAGGGMYYKYSKCRDQLKMVDLLQYEVACTEYCETCKEKRLFRDTQDGYASCPFCFEEIEFNREENDDAEEILNHNGLDVQSDQIGDIGNPAIRNAHRTRKTWAKGDSKKKWKNRTGIAGPSSVMRRHHAPVKKVNKAISFYTTAEMDDIGKPNGVSRGSGFLVAPNVIVTCRHVVDMQHKESKEMDLITGRESFEKLRIKDSIINEEQDIGVFILEKNIQHPVRTIKTVGKTPLYNTKAYIQRIHPFSHEQERIPVTIRRALCGRIFFDGHGIMGDSGSPVFDSNDCLIGVYTGMCKKTGYGSAVLFDNDIFSDIQSLIQEEHAGVAINLPDNFKNIIKVPDHLRAKLASKTKLKPTVFQRVNPKTKKMFIEPTRGPPVLKPVMRDGVLMSPLENGLKDYANVAKPFDSTDLDEAVDNVFSEILQWVGVSCKRLSQEEAINGKPGDLNIPPLNFDSSSGYPFSVLRGGGKRAWLRENLFGKMEPDKDLQHEIDRLVENALEGKELDVIFSDQFKDEKRSFEKILKVNTRIFNASPLHFTIVMRSLVQPIIAKLMENAAKIEINVGVNPHSVDWEIMKNRLCEKKFYLAGDFKAFDKNMNSQTVEAVGKVIKMVLERQAGYSQADVLLFERLWGKIVESDHIIDVYRYTINSANPSGNCATTLLNCIANMLYFRVAYKSITGKFISDFSKDVNFFSFGDDNMFSTDLPEFNMVNLHDFFGKHGITYTFADKTTDPNKKFDRLSDITFLKRKFEDFVFNGEVMVKGPLDLASIANCLCWSKDPENEALLGDQIRACLQELWYHGNEGAELNQVIKDVCHQYGLDLPFSLDREDHCIFLNDTKSRTSILFQDFVFDLENHSGIVEMGTSANQQITEEAQIQQVQETVNEFKVETVQDSEQKMDMMEQMLIRNIFSRPVNVREATISTATPLGFVYAIEPIGIYLITNAIARGKTLGFRYLKCRPVIKLRINASKFHYGALYVGWIPRGRAAIITEPDHVTETMHHLTGYPGRVVNITGNSEVDVEIPWHYPNEVIDLTGWSASQGMSRTLMPANPTCLGLAFMTLLTPLRGNGDTVPPVTAQWWVSLEDVELYGWSPAPMNNLMQRNYERTFVSNATLPLIPTLNVAFTDGLENHAGEVVNKENGQILEAVRKNARHTYIDKEVTVSDVTSTLRRIPFAGPIIAGVVQGATTISNIARFFGFAKPLSVQNNQLVQLKYPELVYSEGENTARAIGFNPDNNVYPLMKHMISSIDQYSVAKIASKQMLLTSLSYFESDEPNTRIFAWDVNPLNVGVFDGGDIIENVGITDMITAENYLSHVASCASYWRGGIVIKYKILASAFHAGYLRLSWMPGNYVNTSDPFNWNNTYNVPGTTLNYLESNVIQKVIDISSQEQQAGEFVIPYISNKPWLMVDPTGIAQARGYAAAEENRTGFEWANGLFMISVVNKLTHPTSPVPQVDIVLFVGAEEETFQLARFSETNMVLNGASQITEFYTLVNGENVLKDRKKWKFAGKAEAVAAKQQAMKEQVNLENHTGDIIDCRAIHGEEIHSIRQILARPVIVMQNRTAEPYISGLSVSIYNNMFATGLSGQKDLVNVSYTETSSLPTLEMGTPNTIAWAQSIFAMHRGGFRVIVWSTTGEPANHYITAVNGLISRIQVCDWGSPFRGGAYFHHADENPIFMAPRGLRFKGTQHNAFSEATIPFYCNKYWIATPYPKNTGVLVDNHPQWGQEGGIFPAALVTGLKVNDVVAIAASDDYNLGFVVPPFQGKRTIGTASWAQKTE